MGLSFRNDRPVRDLILERYPATIELAIVAMLIAILIAIPLGVIAGTNPRHAYRQRRVCRRAARH